MMSGKFHQAFIEQLKDLYDAERQITEALPKMVQSAQNDELREALEMHLEETRGQIKRLDRIFKNLETPAEGKTCKGMQGLLKEADETIKKHGGSVLGDALIIGQAQRVEHYEISAYGTARAWAEEMGHDEVAELLDETLDEEAAADEKLSSIAEGGLLATGVNEEAGQRA